jgi:hypothetical protein
MFRGLFGTRATTKSDVLLAVVGALFAAWKAIDTVKTYKIEQEIKEINA